MNTIPASTVSTPVVDESPSAPMPSKPPKASRVVLTASVLVAVLGLSLLAGGIFLFTTSAESKVEARSDLQLANRELRSARQDNDAAAAEYRKGVSATKAGITWLREGLALKNEYAAITQREVDLCQELINAAGTVGQYNLILNDLTALTKQSIDLQKRTLDWASQSNDELEKLREELGPI